MKNPTWDENRPHSKEEIKAEIDRLLREVEGMMERTRQNHARTDVAQQETARTIRLIQEKLNVGKPA